MKNMIITIGREFGSGGRELGRRLSEELKIAYYDHEIVTEIARRTDMSEQYVQQIMEHRPIKSYPIRIGRTFHPTHNPLLEQTTAVFQQQCAILREMAEASSCVIVGRCADHILRDCDPFRLFVYAEMPGKLARCRQKGQEHEDMTDKELTQHILDVDKGRARYYEFYTGKKWGARTNYDLCINTSVFPIRQIAHAVARLVEG